MKQVLQGSAPAPGVQREAAVGHGWIIQNTHETTYGFGWLRHYTAGCTTTEDQLTCHSNSLLAAGLGLHNS